MPPRSTRSTPGCVNATHWQRPSSTSDTTPLIGSNHVKYWLGIAGLIVGVVMAWPMSAQSSAAAEYFAGRLPSWFPVPKVPVDNPLSEAKVDLGRFLFYDPQLSGNGTFSCASCHQQALAFTDGLARAVGSMGGVHPRSSMSLANVVYNASFGWEDRR